MKTQSACYGCCLQPNFIFNPYFTTQAPTSQINFAALNVHPLTVEEKEVLHLLGEAFNKFGELSSQGHDDKAEFKDAIHRAQQIIALRVARRVDPDVWSQP